MKKWKQNCIDYDKLSTLFETDLLVCGGGPAGVSAAFNASNLGLNVILIEKYGFCGGSATAGMSATICGLYTSNENAKNLKQIVFGFADFFKNNLLKNGGLTKTQVYGNTYVHAHEARVWKKTADELLCKSGTKILYHANIVDVILEDNIIKGVVVFSALGFGKILAKRVIDSTGDGSVATMCGENFKLGLNGIVQNPTIIFKLSNIKYQKFWKFYKDDTICTDDFSKKLAQYEKKHQILLPRKKIWVFKTVNKSEIFINATAISHQSEKLNMINPEHFTYSEISSRKQMVEYANFFKDEVSGCEDSYIGEQGCEVGVRQTRSIKCLYTLKNKDVQNCKKFDDGIVKSAWPIELHKGEIPKLHWLDDDYYEVPYRTLVPKKTANLLVAGRCISAEHEALASSRVTAQCFEYGNAAAVAAKFSLKNNLSFDEIDGKELRKALELNNKDLR